MSVYEFYLCCSEQQIESTPCLTGCQYILWSGVYSSKAGNAAAHTAIGFYIYPCQHSNGSVLAKLYMGQKIPCKNCT